MPNDQVPPVRYRRGSLAAGLLGTVLASLLIALALPRCLSAWAALGANEVLWDARQGATPAPAVLIDAAAALAQAGVWQAAGTIDLDRGFLLVEAGRRMAAGPERDAVLAAAIAATTSGLAHAPADPSAWARLAALHLGPLPPATGSVATDKAKLAAAALRLSLLAGPVVPVLTNSRLSLGLQLLPYLDQEGTALLSRQIRIAWLFDPAVVARLSTTPAYQPLITAALDQLTPDDLVQFRRLHPAAATP